MKKTRALLAALFLVAALAACANNAPASAPSIAPDSGVSQAGSAADSAEQEPEAQAPAVTNQDELVAALGETQFTSGISGASSTGNQIFTALSSDNTKGVFAQIDAGGSMTMTFGDATVKDNEYTIMDALTGKAVVYTVATDADGGTVLSYNGEEITCETLDEQGVESALQTVTSALGY